MVTLTWLMLSTLDRTPRWHRPRAREKINVGGWKAQAAFPVKYHSSNFQRDMTRATHHFHTSVGLWKLFTVSLLLWPVSVTSYSFAILRLKDRNFLKTLFSEAHECPEVGLEKTCPVTAAWRAVSDTTGPGLRGSAGGVSHLQGAGWGLAPTSLPRTPIPLPASDPLSTQQPVRWSTNHLSSLLCLNCFSGFPWLHAMSLVERSDSNSWTRIILRMFWKNN